MKGTTKTTKTAEELQRAGNMLMRYLKEGVRVFALEGPLGAGKTTLIQGFAQTLGVSQPVTSPTFTVIQQYNIPKKETGYGQLVHIDLYRIEQKNELAPLHLHDYVTDETLLICIEWADRFPELYDHIKHLRIRIRIGKNQERRLDLTVY